MCGPSDLQRFSWECEHRANREIDGLSVNVPLLKCTGLMRTSLFCCTPAQEQLQREDSTSDISEVILSSVGPQPPAPRLGVPVAGVVYVTVHFTWASNEHSAPHFMSARIGSTVVLGSISPLIFKSCGWHLPVYRVALRSMFGCGDNVSSPPVHLERHVVLAKLIRSRRSH